MRDGVRAASRGAQETYDLMQEASAGCKDNTMRNEQLEDNALLHAGVEIAKGSKLITIGGCKVFDCLLCKCAQQVVLFSQLLHCFCD